MEGGKDRRKPKGERNPRLPAPPFGRCAQTREAPVRNRGTADGGAVRLAIPLARTGVPPCQASRLAKPEERSRLASGRESADALQKGRRGGSGCSHFRSHSHQLCRKRVRKQGRRPAGGRSQTLQSRYEGVARCRCQSRAREGAEKEQGGQQEGENRTQITNHSQLVQLQDRTGPSSERRPRSPHS